jgi:hypothetical protein
MSGSQRKKEGYLLVDHRSGPGLTEAEARVAGLDPRLAGEGAIYESATYTCSHCQTVVIINPQRTRSRGYCRKCNHNICDRCEAARVANGGECMTMNERIDRIQNAAVKGQLGSRFLCT